MKKRRKEKFFKLNSLGDEWRWKYNEDILSLLPSSIICAFIISINFAQNIKSVRQKIKQTHSLLIMDTKREKKQYSHISIASTNHWWQQH